MAKQAHKENIDQVVELALRRSRTKWQDIQAIAVTQGPGLAPALEVGIAKAKELAIEHNKPLIAVNHIEGHVLSVLAVSNSKLPNIKPPISPVFDPKDDPKGSKAERRFGSKSSGSPVLSIIVSGGHTEFILMKKVRHYQRLGWTIDDAAGEALDKVGRMFDLGYPAGPIIEEFAKKGNQDAYKFPLPMTTTKNYHLSFSGLKTFARNLLEELELAGSISKSIIYDLCASFQYAVFRHICYKLSKILLEHKVGQIWLGGGVAANITLRRMIREAIKPHRLQLILPYSQKLCMDNAAMIGVAAGFKLQRSEIIKNLESLERKPQWKVDG